MLIMLTVCVVGLADTAECADSLEGECSVRSNGKFVVNRGIRCL